ncbi:MAG: radical SAM protein, partial [Ignavibacteriae bacterium]|nr:radical SAM protein [Ignavibacteriota bacterium]
KTNMKIIAKTGNENIATVYIAKLENGGMIEFVESVQPPLPIEKKWVLIVSTLCGCPVNCTFCDAGGSFKKKLSKEEIFSQIDYMVTQRFPDRVIPAEKFKIQFARVGEPSFNPAVLDVLEKFYDKYKVKNFIPSISTIAPKGTEKFFEQLLEIKRKLYEKSFQLQFSLHTTDLFKRDEMIPVKKWTFEDIAKYSEKFFQSGERKITLNFALAEGNSCDAEILLKYFDPKIFLIKFTPLNPTYKAKKNNLKSYIKPEVEHYDIIESIKNAGYESLISIGELEENKIGSNCGQYITSVSKEDATPKESYSYKITEVI